MTATDRAFLVTEKLLPMLEKEARERQATSGPGGYGGQPLSAELHQAVNGKAAEHAAQIVGISPRLVQYAKRISAKAPELVDEVKSRALSMDAASALAGAYGGVFPPSWPCLAARDARLASASMAWMMLSRICRHPCT